MSSVPVNTLKSSVSVVTVPAATATTIAASGANNIYLMLQNLGTSDAWVQFGNVAAAVDGGFLLKANGGTVEFSSLIPLGGISIYSSSQIKIAYILA